MVREDDPEDKRLVAYVVPTQESVPTASELRTLLKSKLPDYMMPSVFVFLNRLALTANGKVDRKALPAPDQSTVGERSYVAPRTEVEKRLAVIWAEVLRLEQVGIHEDFFSLGGHSLLATQVMSRVRNAFQLEIALRTLFENPTVADLAVQIVQLQAQSNAAEDVAQVLADVESLSDEEAKRLLAQGSSQST
jgi:acyl carrier protein